MTKSKKKVKIPLLLSWKDEHYVTAYELAAAGHSDKGIQQAMGVSDKTWNRWLEHKPAFKAGLKRARDWRGGKDGNAAFRDFVANRLPPRLRGVWDEIVQLDEAGNAEEMIDALTANQGKQARQWLWVQAFVHCRFVKTDACKMTGVSSAEVNHWKEGDPDFAELIDVVLVEAKKDFCEAPLMRLVELGDPQIVRFVNETLNADRGYSKKSQLTLNGSVTHELQESRTVEDILGMISLSAQREVLAALEGKLPPRQLNPVEVEVQNEREDEDS
jgi:hypothetical protein